MVCRIHHAAYVAKVTLRRLSKRSIARMSPIVPSWTRSGRSRPWPKCRRAIATTSRRWASTSRERARAAALPDSRWRWSASAARAPVARIRVNTSSTCAGRNRRSRIARSRWTRRRNGVVRDSRRWASRAMRASSAMHSSRMSSTRASASHSTMVRTSTARLASPAPSSRRYASPVLEPRTSCAMTARCASRAATSVCSSPGRRPGVRRTTCSYHRSDDVARVASMRTLLCRKGGRDETAAGGSGWVRSGEVGFVCSLVASAGLTMQPPCRRESPACAGQGRSPLDRWDTPGSAVPRRRRGEAASGAWGRRLRFDSAPGGDTASIARCGRRLIGAPPAAPRPAGGLPAGVLVLAVLAVFLELAVQRLAVEAEDLRGRVLLPPTASRTRRM